MTVRLRGHHLLCLLTYKGEGYGPAFVANLDRIAARLTAGEDAVLVAGPDDICAPLTLAGDAPHCDLARVGERDRRALAAVATLLGRRLGPGDRIALDPATVGHLRQAFTTGSIRSACAGCGWDSLCTSTAGGARFADARLHGGPTVTTSTARA